MFLNLNNQRKMGMQSVITQLRRIDGLFSLPEGEAPDRLAELSKRKAKKIQFLFIAIFSIIIYYCVEISSQDYSLTGAVSGGISQGSMMLGADTAASDALTIQSAKKTKNSAVKYSVKLGVFSLIAGLLWLQISFNDRLGDNSYLNSLLAGRVQFSNFSKLFIRGYLNDLLVFSGVMPSSQSEYLCQSCISKSYCRSRVSADKFRELYSYKIWRSVFNDPNADADSYYRLSTAMLKCRAVFYGRLALLNLTIFSSAIYAVHRVFEYYSGRPIHWNSIVVAIAGMSLFSIWLLGVKNNTSGHLGSAGVWAQLKQAGLDFLGSAPGKSRHIAEYVAVVCRSNAVGDEYKSSNEKIDLQKFNNDRLKEIRSRAFDHIDALLLSKLVKIAENGQSGVMIDHQSTIVCSVEDFLNITFPGPKLEVKFLGMNDLRTFLVDSDGVASSRVRQDLGSEGYCAFHKSDLAPCGFANNISSVYFQVIGLDDAGFMKLEALCANQPSLIRKFSKDAFGYLVIYSRDDRHDLVPLGRMLSEIIGPFVYRLNIELQRDHVKQESRNGY
jgi:hypothetical protein